MLVSREIVTIIGLGLGVVGGIAADKLTTSVSKPVILQYNPDVTLLSSFSPVETAWLGFQIPTFTGMNGQSRSFTEVMKAIGHQVLPPETFGSAPRSGKAGKEGLIVRTLPSMEKTFGNAGVVNWGERVNWIAEFPVINQDTSMDVFGLTGQGYVRLRTINPDGTINWYVEMENPLVQRLADGSVNYGNGIIGPSSADIQAANRK